MQAHLINILAQTGYPYTTNEEGTRLDGVMNFIGDWWLRATTAAIILVFLCIAFDVISEKEAAVVERLGKFNRVQQAGLRFHIPLFERVVDVVSLQIMQIQEDVKVKTGDNVFVTLPVVVQYRIREEYVREAYYELNQPEASILALVLNEVKSSAAEMVLQQVFQSRDHLANAVQSALMEQIGGYGYKIINVVIDNPMLSDELEVSFNSVMAATRAQDAATAQAEALRIKAVGEATANAEGMRINAKAIVDYRNTLAEGNAEAIKKMQGDTDLAASELLRYFMVTDGNDAIRDAAGKGATVVVATPNASSTDALLATLQVRNRVNGSAPTQA